MWKKLCLSLCLLGLISCGGNSVTTFLKNISIDSDSSSGETRIGISYEVDLGEGVFPALSLPIYQGQVEVGILTLTPGLADQMMKLEYHSI